MDRHSRRRDGKTRMFEVQKGYEVFWECEACGMRAPDSENPEQDIKNCPACQATVVGFNYIDEE